MTCSISAGLGVVCIVTEHMIRCYTETVLVTRLVILFASHHKFPFPLGVRIAAIIAFDFLHTFLEI